MRELFLLIWGQVLQSVIDLTFPISPHIELLKLKPGLCLQGAMTSRFQLCLSLSSFQKCFDDGMGVIMASAEVGNGASLAGLGFWDLCYLLCQKNLPLNLNFLLNSATFFIIAIQGSTD